jgi:hypothetical protein
MANVRRWYVYLVCLISLQLAAWALIDLVSAILTLGGIELVQAALGPVALLVVSVPVFGVHWFWAQRSAAHEPDERSSSVRQLYLYASLAALISAGAVHAYTLAANLLRLLLHEPDPFSAYGLAPFHIFTYDLVTLVILLLLWLYHWRVVRGDSQAIPASEAPVALRRLYLLGLSAAGVTLTFLGVIHLLRWVLYQFGAEALALGVAAPASDSLASLLVGLLLWLPHWRRAQRLFSGPDLAERASSLRKFYLYAFVFAGALGAVGNATLVLAGFFRGLLGLPPTGDIRDPLPIIAGLGLMWAYHAYVLRSDERQTNEAPRQAGIRRLYLYLVSAVGLTAVLLGLGGVISAAIQSVGQYVLGSGPRELLALSGAGFLAGLPVWIWPWWQIQRAAAAAGAVGADERRSLVRRIYLYGFIFAATMTVLGNAVYLIYRILSQVFGLNASGSLLVDVGQSIAFTFIGIAVWLYHGLLIRNDGRGNRRERAARLAGLEVIVLDNGDDGFGAALLAGLERDLPEVKAALFDPRALAADAAAWQTAGPRLASPGLLVVNWNFASLAAEAASVPIAAAISASAALKLVVPVRLPGWNWAAVDQWPTPALVAHTLQAIKQWAAGDEVRFSRPPSLGAVIGWIAGGLVLLEVVSVVIGIIYYLTVSRGAF